MTLFYYVLILYLISLAIIILALIFSSAPYPKEWEDEEDEKIIEKFKEYEKSQD